MVGFQMLSLQIVIKNAPAKIEVILITRTVNSSTKDTLDGMFMLCCPLGNHHHFQ